MKQNSKYLEFQERLPLTGRKMKTVDVRSKRQVLLGRIEWHGPWRQYVFVPDSSTLYSAGCLADIQSCIDGLMAERKKK